MDESLRLIFIYFPWANLLKCCTYKKTDFNIYRHLKIIINTPLVTEKIPFRVHGISFRNLLILPNKLKFPHLEISIILLYGTQKKDLIRIWNRKIKGVKSHRPQLLRMSILLYFFLKSSRISLFDLICRYIISLRLVFLFF